MRHRSRAVPKLVLALSAGALLAGNSPPPGVELKVTVTGLHSGKGLILACLVSSAKGFPDCSKDAEARKLAVPVTSPMVIDFGVVPAGNYAVALVHDENANHKMDKHLFLPAEGYGFSRDAPVRMGPPSFADAAFRAEGQAVNHTIKMRYMF